MLLSPLRGGAEGLAERMVSDGLLTNFQADHLLAGKWRGFVIAGKYRLLTRVGAGVLASAVSLAAVVCPLAFSAIYFVARAQWPGAIWLSALVVYAIMVPLVLGLRFKKPTAAPAM